MSKSRFDFSKRILSNAQRLGKEAVEVDIEALVYTKSQLDENILKKYTEMVTVPPPILIINTDGILKIVDGHHRVEVCKRKGQKSIFIFLAGSGKNS